MVARYQKTEADNSKNAICEVMQEITLAGLYRGDFFEKAAFYGDACLRIFYSL